MQAARHRGHHGRAECTGTAASGAHRTLDVTDAARLPRCRRRGACPDVVGTITPVNRCFRRPLADRKTTLTRAGARRQGQRLADAYCFGCCCWMHG
ncbi:hypothetical protein EVAR_66976_1 [Eumeta japonica]|uniref:Uncharacterized protein n=1 Tax=Eumeta variegata TaxID=151549 RepID=A0A4C1ZWD7_EUMVA|nr:hypothetical protein EVAR_66976_1 [Eumeta japonica]